MWEFSELYLIIAFSIYHDLYEIYATAGQILYIECLFSHSEGDINLFLYNESYSLITYGMPDTNGERMKFLQFTIECDVLEINYSLN